MTRDELIKAFAEYPGLVDVFVSQGRAKDVDFASTSQANIYGRYSIFEPCAPGDVFGLQVATHGLMNWLGWRPNRFYRRHVSFITWSRELPDPSRTIFRFFRACRVWTLISPVSGLPVSPS